MSTITAVGEAAYLKPGHPPKSERAAVVPFISDDFEGSTSSMDLRFPITSWALASTPANDGFFPKPVSERFIPYGLQPCKICMV